MMMSLGARHAVAVYDDHVCLCWADQRYVGSVIGSPYLLVIHWQRQSVDWMYVSIHPVSHRIASTNARFNA